MEGHRPRSRLGRFSDHHLGGHDSSRSVLRPRLSAVACSVTLVALTVTATATAASPGRSAHYKAHGMAWQVVITPGPRHAMWFTNHGNNSVDRITTSATR